MEETKKVIEESTKHLTEQQKIAMTSLEDRDDDFILIYFKGFLNGEFSYAKKMDIMINKARKKEYEILKEEMANTSQEHTYYLQKYKDLLSELIFDLLEERWE